MGKPYNGVIYEAMKRTRHSYHYAVRRLKKDKINIQKQRLTENLSNNTTFWNQINEINSISKNLPNIVDKAESASKISKIFQNKYVTYYILYSNVPTNSTELDNINSEVDAPLYQDDNS